MTEYKKCSQCRESKEVSQEFYQCAGLYRSECKKCTIKKNVRYQKKNQVWKYRLVDDDFKKLYMREYYAKNKERFADYRSKFKEKYPEYYKKYYRKKKEK